MYCGYSVNSELLFQISEVPALSQRLKDGRRITAQNVHLALQQYVKAVGCLALIVDNVVWQKDLVTQVLGHFFDEVLRLQV